MGKSILLILLSVILGALGQVSIKLGTLQVKVGEKESIHSLLFKYLTNYSVFVGLVFYSFSAVLWIFAVAKVNLSYAYPMVAIGYVVVFTLSYILFHEPISTQRLIGLLIIVIGVILISRS